MKKINVADYYYLAEGKQIKQNEINSGATKFNGQWITNYNESNENKKMLLEYEKELDKELGL